MMEPAVQDDQYFDEWKKFYDRIAAALSKHGVEEHTGRGDFWIVDESNGYRQHKVYFNSLKMLYPKVVDELRRMLSDFPNWEIFVAVYVRGGESEDWPEMGLIIREHEIVDGLQRQYFPPEYQRIQYEGSRIGADRD